MEDIRDILFSQVSRSRITACIFSDMLRRLIRGRTGFYVFKKLCVRLFHRSALIPPIYP